MSRDVALLDDSPPHVRQEYEKLRRERRVRYMMSPITIPLNYIMAALVAVSMGVTLAVSFVTGRVSKGGLWFLRNTSPSLTFIGASDELKAELRRSIHETRRARLDSAAAEAIIELSRHTN